MSMTDPIADMLTRIRNAIQAGHRRVEIPASNQKRAMAQLLKKQGYIDKIEEIDNNAQGTLPPKKNWRKRPSRQRSY